MVLSSSRFHDFASPGSNLRAPASKYTSVSKDHARHQQCLGMRVEHRVHDPDRLVQRHPEHVLGFLRERRSCRNQRENPDGGRQAKAFRNHAFLPDWCIPDVFIHDRFTRS